MTSICRWTCNLSTGKYCNFHSRFPFTRDKKKSCLKQQRSGSGKYIYAYTYLRTREGEPDQNAASSSLGCIHDPDPTYRCDASSDRESEAYIRDARRGKDAFLDSAVAPRRTHLSRFLIVSTLVYLLGRASSLTRGYPLAVSRRVTSRRREHAGRSSRVATVLGQGCLRPITIARADTQQCAFLTSDSPWFTRLFPSVSILSLCPSFSLFFLFFVSLVPSVFRSANLGAPREGPYQRIEGSDASAPTIKIAGGPSIPFPRRPLSLSSSPTATLTGRAFLGSFDPPGRRHSRFRSLNTVAPPP